jgi:hypothetical protein
LIRKIHRQDRWSTISPPSTGPKTGASNAGTPTTIMTRPILAGPAARARTVCPTGMSSAPAAPCSTRKPIRLPAFQANAHSAELVANATVAVMNSRLAPNRSTAHPVVGITTVRASRYPVTTHWIVDSPACKSAPSVRSATLTIVLSSWLMTMPSTSTRPSRTSPGSSRSSEAMPAKLADEMCRRCNT